MSPAPSVSRYRLPCLAISTRPEVGRGDDRRRRAPGSCASGREAWTHLRQIGEAISSPFRGIRRFRTADGFRRSRVAGGVTRLQAAVDRAVRARDASGASICSCASNPARSARSRPHVGRAGRIVARRHALSTTHEPPRRRLAVRALATIVAAFGIDDGLRRRHDGDHRATAVGVLSVDLPDPKRLDTLTFAQPTVVYDRTGTVELGRVPERRAPGRHLRRGPAAGPRRDDDRRGPDVLDQRRLRPRGDPVGGRRGCQRDRERGASTITQQLVRARLLPADVTAPGADATCARPRS